MNPEESCPIIGHLHGAILLLNFRDCALFPRGEFPVFLQTSSTPMQTSMPLFRTLLPLLPFSNPSLPLGS